MFAASGTFGCVAGKDTAAKGYRYQKITTLPTLQKVVLPLARLARILLIIRVRIREFGANDVPGVGIEALERDIEAQDGTEKMALNSFGTRN